MVIIHFFAENVKRNILPSKFLIFVVSRNHEPCRAGENPNFQGIIDQVLCLVEPRLVKQINVTLPIGKSYLVFYVFEMDSVAYYFLSIFESAIFGRCDSANFYSYRTVKL